jgi:hypothetical protein
MISYPNIYVKIKKSRLVGVKDATESVQCVKKIIITILPEANIILPVIVGFIMANKYVVDVMIVYHGRVHAELV